MGKRNKKNHNNKSSEHEVQSQSQSQDPNVDKNAIEPEATFQNSPENFRIDNLENIDKTNNNTESVILNEKENSEEKSDEESFSNKLESTKEDKPSQNDTDVPISVENKETIADNSYLGKLRSRFCIELVLLYIAKERTDLHIECPPPCTKGNIFPLKSSMYVSNTQSYTVFEPQTFSTFENCETLSDDVNELDNCISEDFTEYVFRLLRKSNRKVTENLEIILLMKNEKKTFVKTFLACILYFYFQVFSWIFSCYFRMIKMAIWVVCLPYSIVLHLFKTSHQLLISCAIYMLKSIPFGKTILQIFNIH